MKYLTFLKLVTCLILALSFAFTSCKKTEDTDTSAGSNVKSLNKATFAPKKWYSQGGAFIHDLKAGGLYANNGSWKWKNNTDTLSIIAQNGYPETYWKVYWNTEHEMNCEKIGTFTPLIYKDSLW